MKRITSTMAVLILGLPLAIAGCGKPVKKIDRDPLEKEFEYAPDWVLAGSLENGNRVFPVPKSAAAPSGTVSAGR